MKRFRTPGTHERDARGHIPRVIRAPSRPPDTAGMWTYAWTGEEQSVRVGTAESDAHLAPGDTLASPQTSAAGGVPLIPEQADGNRVDDDAVVATSPVPPRADVVRGGASVDEQLRRLELRLLAEADGDPAAERDVRRHLADSRTRFETARVRTFVPILVEREVRRLLRDQDRPA